MSKAKKAKKAEIKSKWNFINNRYAVIFILGFAVVATILLIRSFAATNTILRLQGETLTGSGTIVNLSDAYNKQALKLTNSTAATGTFSIPNIGTKLLVRSKGDQCGGAPQLALTIDGAQKLLASVSATSWSIYVSNPTIPIGSHTMSAKLVNPYSTTSCRRAVYVDVIYMESSYATATTPPPPAPSPTPSGEAMPLGNLPGWTQTFTDDFTSDAALGSFNTVYGTKWRSYSGPDTAGKISPSKKSEYNTDKVVSVHGGVVDKYLHTEYDTNGYNGAGNYMMSAALLPRINGQLYGRYTVRLKADAVGGYKVAWLLWPDSGQWPHDGEIDFAESNLTENLKAFIHRQNATAGSDQTACKTTNPAVYLSSGWHTVTLEWAPTTNIYVDGVLECSSTDRIPNTPMHLVLQTESELFSPATTNSGHLYLDWVAVYSKQ